MTDQRREQLRSYYRETYEWRKTHGLCVVCGQEPADKGHVTCWRCRANELDRRSAVYYQLVAQKICTQCTKRPATKGVMCEECASKNRERHKKLWQERKARGECPICGRPVAHEKPSTCAKCRAKNNLRRRKAA